MSQALRKRVWTEAEFFAWQETQEHPYELVDGEPRAMTRANNGHNLIALNVFLMIRQRLDGKPCRATAPFDTGIRIPGGNVRYPEVVVDCGPFRPRGYVASEPIFALEVLSPSTRSFDGLVKLDEYRTVQTLRHILLLEQDRAAAQLYSRADAGVWRQQPFQDAAAELPLDALGITLPLAECYAGALGDH